MNHLEDDMDELFGKAGRNYPLKTDVSDWDKVSAALNSEAGSVTPAPKSSYGRFLPLLLLLLIPAVYVFVDKDNVKTADAGVENVSVEPGLSTNEKTLANKEAAQKNDLNKDGLQKRFAPQVTDDKQDSAAPGVLNNEKSVSKNEAAKTKNLIITNAEEDISAAPGVLNNEKSVTKSEVVDTKDLNKDVLQKENVPQVTDDKKVSAAQNLSNNEKVVTRDEVTQTNDLNKDVLQKENVPQVTDAKKSSPTQPVTQDQQAPKAAKNKNKVSTFYYGITASPDVSTIKGQAIKGVGYSAGIIGGYKLNTHFAVEAGAIWSKKKYYTDGKYFSKTKAGIPTYVNIHWLNGGCDMFEFPLVVRYNFKAKKNTFFASAGVTSYIMKKEYYNYSATAGVGNYPYEGSKSYDRSGDHLFANLQISAGYDFSVTPKMNFRIEPYLKAPLKKIGIGSMPITSTGLYLSLTRDFR